MEKRRKVSMEKYTHKTNVTRPLIDIINLEGTIIKSFWSLVVRNQLFFDD